MQPLLWCNISHIKLTIVTNRNLIRSVKLINNFDTITLGEYYSIDSQNGENVLFLIMRKVSIYVIKSHTKYRTVFKKGKAVLIKLVIVII